MGWSQSPQIGSSVQIDISPPLKRSSVWGRNPLKSGQAFKSAAQRYDLRGGHRSRNPLKSGQAFKGWAMLRPSHASSSVAIPSNRVKRSKAPPAGMSHSEAIAVAIPSNRVKRSNEPSRGLRAPLGPGRNPLKSGQAFKFITREQYEAEIRESQSPQIGSSVQIRAAGGRRHRKRLWVAIPSNRVKRSNLDKMAAQLPEGCHRRNPLKSGQAFK